MMKKFSAILLSSTIILGFSFSTVEVAEAKAKTYKNCTELNKVYKGGWPSLQK